MPTIRYTYARDITRHGDGPLVVSDVAARVLVAARRAVLLGDEQTPPPVPGAPTETVGVAIPPADATGTGEEA